MPMTQGHVKGDRPSDDPTLKLVRSNISVTLNLPALAKAGVSGSNVQQCWTPLGLSLMLKQVQHDEILE
jgi:hypothetical protein